MREVEAGGHRVQALLAEAPTFLFGVERVDTTEPLDTFTVGSHRIESVNGARVTLSAIVLELVLTPPDLSVSPDRRPVQAISNGMAIGHQGPATGGKLCITKGAY